MRLKLNLADVWLHDITAGAARRSLTEDRGVNERKIDGKMKDDFRVIDTDAGIESHVNNEI